MSGEYDLPQCTSFGRIGTGGTFLTKTTFMRIHDLDER